jgi:hypothetical protein
MMQSAARGLQTLAVTGTIAPPFWLEVTFPFRRLHVLSLLLEGNWWVGPVALHHHSLVCLRWPAPQVSLSQMNSLSAGAGSSLLHETTAFLRRCLVQQVRRPSPLGLFSSAY